MRKGLRAAPRLRVRAPMPDRIIAGKYVVERVLGSGGMGDVVVGRHRELGTTVAIKIVHPTALSEPDTRDRFKREAHAMARLRGEHVVRVFDVGETDAGVPYMIMEHLEGENLGALLARCGPLPVEDVLRYGVEACEALAEAHAAGIVHRDVKPENLFVARRASGATSIRVLDFGIAKGTFGAAFGTGRREITQTGFFIGTPHYCAPEQVVQGGRIGPRTDVWALGATMYRLLTGVYPFGDQVSPTTIARIIEDEPLPVDFHRAEVPASVVAIVARCLQKNPNDRFRSMGDLARALGEARRTSTGHSTVPLAPPRAGGAPVTDLNASLSTTRQFPLSLPPGAATMAMPSLPPRDLPSQRPAAGRTPPASMPRIAGVAVAATLMAVSVLAVGVGVVLRKRPLVSHASAAPSEAAPPTVIAAPSTAPLPTAPRDAGISERH
jgi:eukaryotic-like serine/threonine-protein kinase